MFIPASHRAGWHRGCVADGRATAPQEQTWAQDPALRTADPNVQKIFRAMQKYGLIVADNGSDMYITGTFDTRWNNGMLNPAFALLSASDFEVVKLGWTPAVSTSAALASLTASPTSVIGGGPATGTVALNIAATSPVTVALSSASSAASVPASVTIATGATSASFAISTKKVTVQTATSFTASYAGVQKSTTFTLNPVAAPPVLATLTLAATSVVGGSPVSATVKLSSAAPAAGVTVSLRSTSTLVTLPASVVVPAGATSKTFTIATRKTASAVDVGISASYAGVTKSTTLKVRHK